VKVERLQIRQDTTAGWAAYNPTLMRGEWALEVVDGTGDLRVKLGDGVSTWAALPYFVSDDVQPLDSDLTAIAGLGTTEWGRALLTQIDAAGTRTTLGLGTAATRAHTAFDAAGTAASAVMGHAAELDPHPAYVTGAELTAALDGVTAGGGGSVGVKLSDYGLTRAGLVGAMSALGAMPRNERVLLLDGNVSVAGIAGVNVSVPADVQIVQTPGTVLTVTPGTNVTMTLFSCAGRGVVARDVDVSVSGGTGATVLLFSTGALDTTGGVNLTLDGVGVAGDGRVRLVEGANVEMTDCVGVEVGTMCNLFGTSARVIGNRCPSARSATEVCYVVSASGDVVVEDNRVTTFCRGGFRVSGAAARVWKNWATDNTANPSLAQAEQSLVAIEVTGIGADVVGNRAERCLRQNRLEGGGANARGIWVNGDRSTVIANHAIACQNNGIEVVGDRCTVANNIIDFDNENLGGFLFQDAGLKIRGSYVSVTGNYVKVRGDAQEGIVCQAISGYARGVSVTGNTVVFGATAWPGNTISEGIRLNLHTDGTVSGNTVDGAARHAICISYSSNMTVGVNTLRTSRATTLEPIAAVGLVQVDNSTVNRQAQSGYLTDTVETGVCVGNDLGVLTLDDLIGVRITNPTTGDVLRWDGDEWTNSPITVTIGAVLNVKDFGAAGNYLTNDTAAIRAMYTAAGQVSFTSRFDGHTIVGVGCFYPAGSYRVMGTLTVPSGCRSFSHARKGTWLHMDPTVMADLMVLGPYADVHEMTLDGGAWGGSISGEGSTAIVKERFTAGTWVADSLISITVPSDSPEGYGWSDMLYRPDQPPILHNVEGAQAGPGFGLPGGADVIVRGYVPHTTTTTDTTWQIIKKGDCVRLGTGSTLSHCLIYNAKRYTIFKPDGFQSYMHNCEIGGSQGAAMCLRSTSEFQVSQCWFWATRGYHVMAYNGGNLRWNNCYFEGAGLCNFLGYYGDVHMTDVWLQGARLSAVFTYNMDKVRLCKVEALDIGSSGLFDSRSVMPNVFDLGASQIDMTMVTVHDRAINTSAILHLSQSPGRINLSAIDYQDDVDSAAIISALPGVTLNNATIRGVRGFSDTPNCFVRPTLTAGSYAAGATAAFGNNGTWSHVGVITSVMQSTTDATGVSGWGNYTGTVPVGARFVRGELTNTFTFDGVPMTVRARTARSTVTP
jgi:parallel beta-helix repeat protein